MVKKQKRVTTTGSAAPAGYRVLSGGFPKAWSPEIGDTLQGRVMEKRVESAQKLKYDNAKKGQMVTILSVADESTGEIVGVFESAGIANFCKQVKTGDSVFLRLNDVKKIGKKRFKDITAAIKGGK